MVTDEGSLEEQLSPYTVKIVGIAYARPEVRKNSIGEVQRDENGNAIILDIRETAGFGEHVNLTESEAERLTAPGVDAVVEGHVNLTSLEETETSSAGGLEAAASPSPYEEARGEPTPVPAKTEDAAGEKVSLAEMDDAELIGYLRPQEGEPPSVNEVVKATGDDPVLAARLVEAEQSASGGESRENLVKRLRRISDK